ncbi:protein of unknown function (DU1801) [Pilibacter termitis]|uniref:YdhG-like domain-containing protein n=1 Tax=Pilibacter termitis TaxID=263852 RepID=A0A1T4M661_9ENTE|nr:DUF1801 domain-containing protein [Pilibacter termitis]SJZ62489.1 protein of unknown function (DU1801) [Pilibacter termitis]
MNEIEQFILQQPVDRQERLFALAKLGRSLPNVTECISYNMPCFKLNQKPIFYFAPCKKHIGFYPTPNVITKFQEELSEYKTSKGAVQLPESRELPIALIEKMIAYRVEMIQGEH